MRKLIAGLALLGCTAAHAEVVYHWQTLDAQGATSTLLGELRLTDAAAESGGAGVSFRPTACTYNPLACAPGESPGDPTSSVIAISLWVDAWVPGLGANIHEGTGFPDGMQQSLSVSVLGLDEVIAGGSIISGGSSADVEMSGVGGLWSINFLSSDVSRFEFKHCWADFCPSDTGPITGRWVLASQVPLPSTLPLVLLGLAGAGTAVRRRS